jgi:DNA helicase-2/ATP-dependent DNA helicase PcrA
MEKSFNKAQEEAINHFGGPLLMAAGAGSGKTRALTGRLKMLIEKGVRPQEIVAITFTNKAAEEMRQRVFGKDAPKPAWGGPFPTPGIPFIGTFHSFGARIVKEEAVHLGRTKNFTIFDDDDSLSIIKKIAKQMDLSGDRFKPAVVLKKISNLKSELASIEDLVEGGDEWMQTLAEVYRRYENELKKNNAFDFDDLIEKPVRLFRANPEILEKYQLKFSQILVDEYQDINTTQYQLIKLLAQKHNNVSVVGDDAQAIYSFRGADFRNFLNFSRDWPNAKIIRLEQNYRSSGNIISAASAVIKNNTVQTKKNLWTENPDGEKVRLVAAEDQDVEAAWIASEIDNLFTKNPNAEIAIIYRTNAQSRAIEQSLISYNFSYKIFGGLKFYERKEIKDLIAGLKIALNPNDTLSVERLEKALGKRVSAELVPKLKAAGEKLAPVELINFFLVESRYKDRLESKFENPIERMENVAELIEFASQFTTLEELIERVSLLQSADAPSNEKQTRRTAQINLMTIHIAKGLEFDHVFIVGVNEGVLPHEKSMLRLEEVEEERRLMYVAMTRAKKTLYILFHSYPSRFLYEIPTELLQFISPTGNMHGLPSEDDMYIEQ